MGGLLSWWSLYRFIAYAPQNLKMRQVTRAMRETIKERPTAIVPAASSDPCGPCADRASAACQALARSPLFLVTLVLVTALGPLAMSAFVPAIPAIQSDLAVNGSVAQLTLSVSLVAMACASLAYGGLADRYGRRPVLLCGIALGILGSLLCAIGPTIGSVIAGRAVQAAGASTGFVLARVIVQDVYGNGRSTRVLAYITAAMTLAPMLGPLVGGYLIEGVGWRAIFLGTAFVSAAVLALVALRLPETAARKGPRETGGLLPDILALCQTPAYLKFLAFGTLTHAAFFGFIAGAPYVMAEILGYPATVYGYYFAMVPIGYLAGSLLAGRYGTLLGNERLTLSGAIAGVLACALGWLWTAGAATNPLTLFVPAALLSIASGFALPGAQAGMLAAAGARVGAASGLFSFLQLLASALASQLVGVLQLLGPLGLFSVMAGASALGLIGYLVSAAAGGPAGTGLARRRPC